ncbi:MAG: peptidoglycan DD-metalloendopeptidase family protein [Campylobacterota bacterium]|nr:peptidoglycan DD-metalloendopeptidase family protein [Campylobacterota bacterium]
MKFILLLVLSFSFSVASLVQSDIWWRGETLLTFFGKHSIPQKIYFDLSKTDKELCSEISTGVEYQVLYDNNEKLTQALIPISQEMQIHIVKDIKNNFSLDIIPIEYQKISQIISIVIDHSPYLDIVKSTGNKALANEFIIAFKKFIDFRKLHKGDIISIKFNHKIRQGRYFGTPKILGAFVKIKNKYNYIFYNNEDNRYYNESIKEITKRSLIVPLRYKRVSSVFTYKRWHPVLEKYRAHLGVDYAAPTGRKVHSTADGKIIYKGRKGGYGKTIMIRHKNGYKSLYGHLNGYNNKLKVGSKVKQGDYIARVGSTGLSTGPHLHFGLYKNGRAVDPQKIIVSKRNQIKSKNNKKYERLVKSIKTDLLLSEKNMKQPMKLIKFKPIYKII